MSCDDVNSFNCSLISQKKLDETLLNVITITANLPHSKAVDRIFLVLALTE